ncbi:hypothetical protein [Granulicoccus phenolivorans]|uniref:hypothetical protein n=1 Tax=Granulicoccus phenolivorans TaxID=266854 RepID=UPI000410C085|nr:hypothetical protein [Granulicoccus phenolivorans]
MSLLALAMGGGYGHASRVAAARWTLQVTAPTLVVVSDPHLPEALAPGCSLISPPAAVRSRAELRAWVRDLLAEQAPDEVWVDAFPVGVLGELTDDLFEDRPLRHLARRLRWDSYVRRLTIHPPRYDTVWVTEELEPAHRAWLAADSGVLEPLALSDPPLDPGPAAAVDLPEGVWLVIHSGPLQEVAQLVAVARAYASGPIVIIAPGEGLRLPGVHAWLQVIPAAPLADRPEVAGVVTAGGTASLRQYRHLGDRHIVVPLRRPLDDQAWRAAHRFSGSQG